MVLLNSTRILLRLFAGLQNHSLFFFFSIIPLFRSQFLLSSVLILPRISLLFLQPERLTGGRREVCRRCDNKIYLRAHEKIILKGNLNL